MDYEQKYKEALERARKINNGEDVDVEAGTTTCEYIFPELAESEDEKIRKELIRAFKSLNTIKAWNGIERVDILAWLEKQGEQKPYGQRKECLDCQFNYAGECKGSCAMKRNERKPADKVEPKFHEGDWVANDYCVGKVIALTDDAYLLDSGQGIPFSYEHNAHLWTIQDAKDGDVLAVDSMPFIYNGSKNEVTVGAYCGFNAKHRFSFAYNYVINEKITPATKEQRDLLFQKIHEAGYMWDSNSKQLLSLKAEPSDEQKSTECIKFNNELKLIEWSEEDEIGWTNTMIMIKEVASNHYTKDSIKLVIDWLESIKQRIGG